MSIETWLLFCATEAVLCMTPGPAVLLVLSLGVTRGRGAGIRGAIGILLANAIYFVLSAAGITALLVTSPELFVLVKWVGAAYLVFLGLRMLLRPSRDFEDPGEAPRAWRAMGHGFVTQAANPKTLLFFTALLPQFLEPAAGVGAQIAILAVSSVCIEFGVLTVYAALAERVRHVSNRPATGVGLQRAGGLLLIAAAAGLAAVRRAQP